MRANIKKSPFSKLPLKKKHVLSLLLLYCPQILSIIVLVFLFYVLSLISLSKNKSFEK